MSGTPTIDPNLDALRGRAIALKVNGARILELIDEAIAAGPGDVSGVTRYLKASMARAGNYDTTKYNLLGDSLQTVMAAASEAIDLLKSHGIRTPRVTSASLTDQLNPTDQLKVDQSVSQVKSPDGPGGDSFDSAIDGGP